MKCQDYSPSTSLSSCWYSPRTERRSAFVSSGSRICQGGNREKRAECLFTEWAGLSTKVHRSLCREFMGPESESAEAFELKKVYQSIFEASFVSEVLFNVGFLMQVLLFMDNRVRRGDKGTFSALCALQGQFSWMMVIWNCAQKMLFWVLHPPKASISWGILSCLWSPSWPAVSLSSLPYTADNCDASYEFWNVLRTFEKYQTATTSWFPLSRLRSPSSPDLDFIFCAEHSRQFGWLVPILNVNGNPGNPWNPGSEGLTSLGQGYIGLRFKSAPNAFEVRLVAIKVFTGIDSPQQFRGHLALNLEISTLELCLQLHAVLNLGYRRPTCGVCRRSATVGDCCARCTRD